MMMQLRKFSTGFVQCAKLRVFPNKSLADERLSKTIISDLEPNSKVDLKLSVTNKVNLNYSSTTQFQSDSDGIIDLSKAVPTCQSYTSPDLMSIYWTMKPQEDSDTRFWPLKITNGLECKYQVFQNDNLLAEETIQRDFLIRGVQRIEIKEGRIRGTLFVPPGKGPYPAIINIYGGIHKRNVIEDKAAMFASRGFVSLSLAFFGVEGLPKSYADQPLEMDYFEEAIDYLLNHPKVEKSKGVGVCGISKGAEACLAMASTISESKLAAVAVINTIIYHGVMPVHYKGNLVCDAYSLSINEDTFKHVGPNVINILGLFGQAKELEESSVIPFKNCQMPLLFVACQDDQVCPSVLHAKWAEKLMKNAGKKNYEISIHEATGHLVDLPFSPPTTISNHAMFPKPFVLETGGTDLIQHGKNQEKIWHKLLRFFSHHLH